MKNTLFSSENKDLGLLFTLGVNTELSKLLKKAFELYTRCPRIERLITRDLDAYGIEKKKERLLDAAWVRQQTLALGLDYPEPLKDSVEIDLALGRKRMEPLVVYILFLLEGSFQSLTDRQSAERIIDSKTLEFFFQFYSLGEIPARSTRHENVRKISQTTQNYIFRRQVFMVRDDLLDNFENLTVDSTAVKANSVWPTDSGHLNDILHRAYHLSQQLYERFGIPNFLQWFMPMWLKKMNQLNFKINVTSGKGARRKRKKLYGKLYTVAEKAIFHMKRELDKHRSQKEELNILPGKLSQLNLLWSIIEDYMSDAEQVISYSKERILEDKVIKNTEKVISLSDGSAAFITKGDRETVVGYRPQLGRSQNGFVTVLIVPEGNAADSPQLLPLVKGTIKNTGVVPSCVSADDGYSSNQGVRKVKAEGVNWVSINGAKGKKLTSDMDWISEELTEARRMRSAVESLMFVLKDVLGFGKLRRRNIESVRLEMLQKVIVYNFRQMIIVEERNEKRQRQEGAKMLQAS
ncbi:MAG: transposase [Candidatus Sabulitectum sp.]|nr:transposase [Candidatus Sabulitectum sp.]